MNFIKDKVVLITGAASGFGKLTSLQVLKMGGKVVASDINLGGLTELENEANSADLKITKCDTAIRQDVEEMIQFSLEQFGQIDVLVNNAGIMPLGFLADHEKAIEAWDKCIDTNLKGVYYGIIAVYDQMIQQGKGQIINISSIYGNGPVAGGSPYSMTKNAVAFLTDSLRTETKGKIKFTTIKPTFCPTNLVSTIVNGAAGEGLLSNCFDESQAIMQQIGAGTADEKYLDPNNIEYFLLDPKYIADNIVYCMNQPDGVSISDMTIRAAGDYYTE